MSGQKEDLMALQQNASGNQSEDQEEISEEQIVQTIIQLGNQVLRNLGVEEPIDDVSVFFSDAFYIQFFETAFPDIDFSSLEQADNEEDMAENIQALIDLLSQEILKYNLEHIRGDEIVSGNPEHCINLLQLAQEISQMVNSNSHGEAPPGVGEGSDESPSPERHLGGHRDGHELDDEHKEMLEDILPNGLEQESDDDQHDGELGGNLNHLQLDEDDEAHEMSHGRGGHSSNKQPHSYQHNDDEDEDERDSFHNGFNDQLEGEEGEDEVSINLEDAIATAEEINSSGKRQLMQQVQQMNHQNHIGDFEEDEEDVDQQEVDEEEDYRLHGQENHEDMDNEQDDDEIAREMANIVAQQQHNEGGGLHGHNDEEEEEDGETPLDTDLIHPDLIAAAQEKGLELNGDQIRQLEKILQQQNLEDDQDQDDDDDQMMQDGRQRHHLPEAESEEEEHDDHDHEVDIEDQYSEEDLQALLQQQELHQQQQMQLHHQQQDSGSHQHMNSSSQKKSHSHQKALQDLNNEIELQIGEDNEYLDEDEHQEDQSQGEYMESDDGQQQLEEEDGAEEDNEEKVEDDEDKILVDLDELNDDEKQMLLAYLNEEYEKNPDQFPFPKEKLPEIMQQNNIGSVAAAKQVISGASAEMQMELHRHGGESDEEELHEGEDDEQQLMNGDRHNNIKSDEIIVDGDHEDVNEYGQQDDEQQLLNEEDEDEEHLNIEGGEQQITDDDGHQQHEEMMYSDDEGQAALLAAAAAQGGLVFQDEDGQEQQLTQEQIEQVLLFKQQQEQQQQEEQEQQDLMNQQYQQQQFNAQQLPPQPKKKKLRSTVQQSRYSQARSKKPKTVIQNGIQLPQGAENMDPNTLQKLIMAQQAQLNPQAHPPVQKVTRRKRPATAKARQPAHSYKQFIEQQSQHGRNSNAGVTGNQSHRPSRKASKKGSRKMNTISHKETKSSKSKAAVNDDEQHQDAQQQMPVFSEEFLNQLNEEQLQELLQQQQALMHQQPVHQKQPRQRSGQRSRSQSKPKRRSRSAKKTSTIGEVGVSKNAKVRAQIYNQGPVNFTNSHAPASIRTRKSIKPTSATSSTTNAKKPMRAKRRKVQPGQGILLNNFFPALDSGTNGENAVANAEALAIQQALLMHGPQGQEQIINEVPPEEEEGESQDVINSRIHGNSQSKRHQQLVARGDNINVDGEQIHAAEYGQEEIDDEDEHQVHELNQQQEGEYVEGQQSDGNLHYGGEIEEEHQQEYEDQNQAGFDPNSAYNNEVVQSEDGQLLQQVVNGTEEDVELSEEQLVELLQNADKLSPEQQAQLQHILKDRWKQEIKSQKEMQYNNIYNILTENVAKAKIRLASLGESPSKNSGQKKRPGDDLKTLERIMRQKKEYENLLKSHEHDQKAKHRNRETQQKKIEKQIAREMKLKLIKEKKFEEELINQQKSLMYKRNAQQVRLCQRVYKLASDLEKNKLLEEKREFKETQATKATQKKLMVDAIETFYKDKITMLKERIETEKFERKIAQSAQTEALTRMKQELNFQKKSEIEKYLLLLKQEDQKYDFQSSNLNKLESEIVKLYKK